MRGRALVITCAVASAVVATLAAPASAASGAAPRPAAVTGLAPFQKQGPVTLTWTNPRDIDRDVVRLARGPKAPATTSAGRAVTLGRPRASQAVLTHLVPGRQYSVAVWTKRNGRLSRSATTSFTTKPAPSAPVGGPTGTLAGHVADTSGDPLRNADVLAYGDVGRGFFTRTDSQGAFRMRVPRGRYYLGAFGPLARGGTSDNTGYLYAFKALPVGTGHTDLHFVLADAGAITGTVTDSRGTPLRRVQVQLEDPPAYLDASNGGYGYIGGGPGYLVRTDAAGRYRFTGVAPGAFVPCFATRGARGGRSDAAGYVSRCDDRSVAAGARQVTSAGTVALASAPKVTHGAFGAIAGTVTRANGKPASGIRIAAYNPSAGSTGASGRTDAHGRFVLRKIAPGRYFVCAAHDAGDNCKLLRVKAGRTTRTALHFRRAGSLSGVVRDTRGNRLGNVIVEADHTTANGGFGVGTGAGPHGDWTIGGLPAGLYKVCFGGGGSARDPFGGRSGCLADKVRVVSGRDRIGVERTLAPGGAISGTVTDSSGRAVADANVFVVSRSKFGYDESSSTTGPNGTFLATGLDPGTFEVCAELDYDTGGALSHCVKKIAVVAKRVTKGVDLALPPDSSLTATVTDGANHPLSGVDVAVLSACRSGQYCTSQPFYSPTTGVSVDASAVTGPDGAVTVHGLRPGHYTACALAYYAASADTTVPSTGYADKCAGSGFSVHVTSGGNATTTIALDPAAAVSGVVRNPSGAALAGVAMHVARSAAFDYVSDSSSDDPLYPSPRNDVLTGADGRYTVRGVAPGSRSVCGVPPAALGVRRGCLAGGVNLPAGTTTEAPTLTLPAAQRRANMRVARIVAAMPMSFLPRRAQFLPAGRTVRVISSNGWPAYRLLPKH